VGNTSFVAPSAQVIGKVQIGSSSSIGFGTTIRGDVNEIKIGDRVTVGDLVSVHVTRSSLTNPGSKTLIGHGAVVGL
jgi:carbonic anhydrase/acetyltransferase-like protein (isoleucine patch superfamily)